MRLPSGFIVKIMITIEALHNTISNYLDNNGLFLVDIEVSKDNDITITIERHEGSVKVEDCVAIDKIVSGVFDRDTEDYSLTVTSAGLDQPFKVAGQYRKFLNTEVEIVLKKGGKLKGMLTNFNEEEIEITTSKMVKKEGFKKKVQEETITPYRLDELKSCKPVIKFK